MTQQPGPAGRGINLRGAVDLSSLARPAATSAAAPASRSPFAVAVTEATFQQVIDTSMTVPVVVDLGSPRAAGSAQLSPLLERLADAYSGAFLLAQVDVDASPQVAAAFQIQQVPSVVAVIKGQPVPLFTGPVAEEQVRRVLDEMLTMAQANGVTGVLEGGDAAGAAADDEDPPLPPLHQAAYEAIERDDLEGAVAAYEQALLESPADLLAKAGLAQVRLLARTRDADLAAARAAAAAAPDDVEAQLLVADLDFSGGHVEDAFARLVALVARTAGPEREATRTRMLELFEVLGGDDERVVAARRALTNALY